MSESTAPTWGQSILTYLKTLASAHIVIVALAIVGFLLFRSFMAEHDARLLADATVKTAQTTIAGLQSQQATVTKQAGAQVVILKQEAAAVQTAPEAVAALEAPKADIQGEVTPLAVQSLPDAPSRVSVAALPLEELTNTCAIDEVNLTACTASLGLEKQIDAQKDIEITALKKKPGFWAAAKKDLITAGIGVGIGYALHK